MAQNIYDNEEFFEKYAQMDRSIDGIGGALEWSSMSRMLPPLNGLRIVDLGCGYGWFSRYAIKRGAKEVLGLDISSKMLQKAQEMTDDNRILYRQQDLEKLRLPEKSYDLVYSSLVFHYIEDLSSLFGTVHSCLKDGGHFIFSVEHPINTAVQEPEWTTSKNGRNSWVLNGYQREGKRLKNWLIDGVVKYHRLLSTYLNTLIKHGFVIKEVDEWCPTDEQIEKDPSLEVEKERARFLLIYAVKS